MKKALSLLLAAMLLLASGAALAETIKIQETARAFDVTVVIPDGATVVQDVYDDWVCVEFQLPGEDGMLEIDLSVAPSEEFAGRSLSEADEDERALLVELSSINFLEPAHEFFTLSNGTPALFSIETGEGMQFATMQTIYKGFFIYLYCGYEDHFPLADNDLALMYDIMDSLVFTDVAE